MVPRLWGIEIAGKQRGTASRDVEWASTKNEGIRKGRYSIKEQQHPDQQEHIKDNVGNLAEPQLAANDRAAAYRQALQQYQEGMAKHREFREHSQTYQQASSKHLEAIKEINSLIEVARESAASTTLDRSAPGYDGSGGDGGYVNHQEEIERLQQSRREQLMVHDGLRQEFSDLQREFIELKRPENDVVELERLVEKLGPRHGQ